MKKISKRLLMLLLLCCFSISYAQTKTNQNENSVKLIGFGSCEDGIERAIKDAKNKKYRSYSYGLIVRTEEQWKFNTFYEKYMKSKYGILVKDGGCVITPENKCYSRKMKALIKAEFGTNIFERALAEAKELYSKKK